VTEVAGVNNPVTLFSVLYAERGSAERAVMAGIVVEATNAAAELLGDEVAEGTGRRDHRCCRYRRGA
jgi:hypothetical protein